MLCLLLVVLLAYGVYLVWRLLFVVCCVLCLVCCAFCVVCGVLIDGRCSMFVVCCLMCIGCSLFVVRCWLLVAGCSFFGGSLLVVLLVVVGWSLFVGFVRDVMFDVWCCLLFVVCFCICLLSVV